MEPVTHTLTGALLARSGFNRKAAYATAAMAIAAEFPDIDTVSSVGGPVAGFVHHRGITHTFLGLPLEAAFLLGCFYGLHRWRLARARNRGVSDLSSITAAPVRWGMLYLLMLLALCSHLLLDFTNNYGIRPFAPFNPHWYAASIVFIFDPLLFVFLLAGLLLPALLRLVGSEISSTRSRSRAFSSKAPAQVVLTVIAGYYLLRVYEHLRAGQLAQAQFLALAAPNDAGSPTPILTAQRSLVSPDPLSVFRWHAVTDFGPAYLLAEIDTYRGTILSADTTERKANTADPTIRAAIESPIGRAYLDWSSMPWIAVDRPDLGITPGQPTVVTFTDPRFMGDVPILRSRSRTPLTATVELDTQNHVLAQTLDGKLQP
ncbi:MAG: metal-dependent hydrolase [Acidobacteriaceae bacterium]|nr:metal-dependent hydrolase [Acidobacteriaceae bacterium]